MTVNSRRAPMLIVSLSLALLRGCGFASNQTYTVDRVARFTLPSGWIQRDAERRGQWSAFSFHQPQSSWSGAGNPLEVEGWVVLGAPRSSPDDLQQGMDFAFDEVQGGSRRFPESGETTTGSRTTWTSEGNYQANALHDPEKVTFLRSVDPERQAALVLRVYQRRITHEMLRAIEQQFFSSLEYQDGRVRPFSSAAASLAAGKQRRAHEIGYLNSFLAARGLPPIDPRNPFATHAHNGWVYAIRAGQFVIARRTGDGPKGPLVVERGRGELVWLQFEDGAWQPGGPRIRTRPPGNQPYYQSQPVPAEWSKTLALDADRTRRYFFHVWSCELTPMDSEESHEPAGWELDAWFAQAQAADAQFREIATGVPTGPAARSRSPEGVDIPDFDDDLHRPLFAGRGRGCDSMCFAIWAGSDPDRVPVAVDASGEPRRR